MLASACRRSFRRNPGDFTLELLGLAVLVSLLPLTEAAPGIGYALEFGAYAETSSPKSRLGGLAGLQAAGWTISAWLKYTDASSSTLMSDISLTSSADHNLMNGFGGAGAKSFAFSTSVSYSEYLPTADFAEWHHFAMSFDVPKAAVTQFVDGVNVKQWSVSGYSALEKWADDAALNLGVFCSHAAEGTPRNCKTNRLFLGQMDDVAFFVGALSEADVAERWNSSLTQRLADGLEPSLAIFYDFNDPLTTPGETANLGYAGADFDLVHGRLDMSQTGAIYVADDETSCLRRHQVIASPNVVPMVPIAHKAAEPDSVPRVTYAAPGARIDLAALLGMAAGQSYTAPVPFSATAVLLEVPTAEGSNAVCHIVPLAAPALPEARWCSISTSEDVPAEIQLLTGPGHTWNENTIRVLARPPKRGVLYQQERKEGRSLKRPITKAGDVIELSANVLYVPEENGFGEPFDSFSVYFRLNGTNDRDVSAGMVMSESAPFNVTISVSPVDDIPAVLDVSVSIDEDTEKEITLQLSDSEVGQVLAGHITRLPSKGTLFAVNGSGHRMPIGAKYNPFDVGSPVLRQYLSRVVAVSSFWGSSPPYSGYHPLGILGAPDCENNLKSNECTGDQPWVAKATVFPELGTHVLLNRHTAYVRAIHAVGSTIGGPEGALDLEMHQYYADAGNGSWQPCYMDPYDTALTYPSGCLIEAEGGGLNTAFGRPVLLTVSRSAIGAVQAAIWSPSRQGYEGDTLLTGGGMFGPQYVYSHRQSDSYRGYQPYTEFIEVAVTTPVYIFGIVIGMPRGVGSIVAIRARDPEAEEGSGAEWVRMYEAKPLLDEYQKNLEAGGPYWKWAPNVCRTSFLTDTIRIEVDTSEETGATDWNYIDAVEIHGSTSIQAGALRQKSNIGATGGRITSNVKVVYVPNLNAHGDDSFEYTANDCTGDTFRASEPGLVSIAIDGVNDTPMLIVDAATVTNTAGQLNFSALVADIETVNSQLVIEITALPPGTASHFYDGPTLVSPLALPHRLTNALHVLSFRFDSLVGLKSFQVSDGKLLREAATAHVGFTATDLHGGAAAFTVQLKLTTASLLCVAEDHEVIFEGGQPVCSACAPGRAANPSSPSCDICADGYFRQTDDDGVSSSCGACPHFALHCQRDATLASLNLKPGYYRHSNTTHVRLCLDFSAGRSASTSACIGSGPWIGTCRPWTTGPYCSLCNASDGSRYYDVSQSACLACEGNTVLLPVTIWAVTITITLFVLLWFSWCKPWRCVPLRVRNRAYRTARMLLFTLRPPLKQMVALYQIAPRLEDVFKVIMPQPVRHVLRVIDVFNLNIDVLGIPLACLQLGSVYHNLLSAVLLPLFLALLILAGCTAAEVLAARDKVQESASLQRMTRKGMVRNNFLVHQESQSPCSMTLRWLKRVLLRALPYLLGLSFLAFPMVSSLAFQVFDCEEFDVGSSFLRADYSVDCNDTDQYGPIRTLAWVAIAFYPLAIPICCHALLLSTRKAILTEDPTPFSRSLELLHEDYEPEYYWWEIIESTKKVFLVGFCVIIAPAGSIVQLIYGFVFSLAVLLLTSIMEPYDRRSADCFSLLCNFSIVSLLFFTLVLRVGDLAKEVEGVLSEEHQALYTYDSTLVSMALITILLASIAVNLLLTVYQIRKSVHDSARVVRAEAALYAARGRMNNPPTCKWKLKDGNQYLTFLSHYKVEAGSDARYLSDLIRRMTGCPAYLDSIDLVDLRALFNEGVHKTDVMIVLATKEVFTRPWCLLEMWEAAVHQVPIVLFPVVGKSFELEATVELLGDLEAQMLTHNPTCLVEVMNHVAKQGVVDVCEVQDVLLAHLGLVPTLERTGRAEPGRVCAHLQRDGAELESWLAAHHKTVKQRLGVLSWQAWSTDNQLIATAQTLIEECALVLGRERPKWKENEVTVVVKDARTAPHASGFEGRLREKTRLAVNHRSSRIEQSVRAESSRRNRLLIIAAGEECGGSTRVLQEQLRKRLRCEVVISSGKVDTWRCEVEGSTNGVILLQTKSVLRHPVRLLQLLKADDQNYPVVCVSVANGGYDFATVIPLLKSLRTELSQEELETLHCELYVDGSGLGKLSSCLCRAMPSAISVFFNPGGGSAMLDAAVKDVILKLARTKQLLNSRSLTAHAGRKKGLRRPSVEGDASALSMELARQAHTGNSRSNSCSSVHSEWELSTPESSTLGEIPSPLRVEAQVDSELPETVPKLRKKRPSKNLVEMTAWRPSVEKDASALSIERARQAHTGSSSVHSEGELSTRESSTPREWGSPLRVVAQVDSELPETVPNFTPHSVRKKRPSKNAFDSLSSSQYSQDGGMEDFGLSI